MSIKKWYCESELEGLLFFVQRCYEMLFDYSVDCYKFPVLTTSQLTVEYCETQRLVIQGIIDKKYLSYILDEFINSLNKDIVIKEKFGREEIDHFLHTIGSCTRTEIGKRMSYYADTLFYNDRYFYFSVFMLQEYIKQPKEKRKIDFLAKSFISELISKGYSSGFILHNLNKFFPSRKPMSIDSLNGFLGVFTFNPSHYDVYFAAKRSILGVRDILKEKLKISFEDDGNFNKLKHSNDYIVFSIKNIQAMDDNIATQKAFHRINLLKQYYEFSLHKREIFIFKKAMIIDKRDNHIGYVNTFETEEFNFINEHSNFEAKLVASSIINIIIESSKKINSVFDLFYRIVILHNNAAFGDNYENGFINLWKIIEMIIPVQENNTDSDKEKGITKYNRIETIVDAMVPVFKKNYMLKLFTILSKDLESISKEKYDSLISRISLDGTNIEKIAAFVLLPEYSTLRDEIFTDLDKNPLMKHRIHQLGSNFKNIKHIQIAIDDHVNRVKWHLYRIYRTRNSIVHAGIKSANIKLLGEHLHIYVDEFLNEIITVLASNLDFSSIDSVLFDIKKNCELFDSNYNINDIIDDKNIKPILHHKFIRK